MPDYFIAFWNVENLFHTEDFAGRSDKLQRAIDKDSVQVFRPMIMRTSSRKPAPRRYGGMGKKVDKDGFSDHFPIAVTVRT